MRRPNEFGTALRIARSLVSVGLRELAAYLTISPSYLSDVERGFRAPLRPSVIAAVARRLKADQAKLVAAAERDVIARWRSK